MFTLFNIFKNKFKTPNKEHHQDIHLQLVNKSSLNLQEELFCLYTDTYKRRTTLKFLMKSHIFQILSSCVKHHHTIVQELLISLNISSQLMAYKGNISSLYKQLLICIYKQLLICIYKQLLICIYKQVQICIYKQLLICIYKQLLICIYE